MLDSLKTYTRKLKEWIAQKSSELYERYTKWREERKRITENGEEEGKSRFRIVRKVSETLDDLRKTSTHTRTLVNKILCCCCCLKEEQNDNYQEV